MHIQRYLLKDKENVMYFGKHSQEHTWDYKWFSGEDRIGIENNPSTEAESFIGGFLVRDDELIITPSKKYPRIERKSDSFAVMSGRDSGIKQVSDLIELIGGQEITHAYITSKIENRGYGSVLTFSPIAPPNELYDAGKIMPVRIDTSKLESEVKEDKSTDNSKKVYDLGKYFK